MEERIEYLRNKVKEFGIIKDTEWKLNELTSVPTRGIRDYYRQMEFNVPLNNEELKELLELLKIDKCPGWTGIVVRNIINNKTYRFTTTWDSSD